MAWETLLDIAREAEAYRRDEASRPPASCPNDGEPLESAPDGGLHCRFDGYRPSR
jgi:hypothetical protein